MSDIIIRAESVSKKFSRHLSRSMLYGVRDIATNLVGMGTRSEGLRKDEFWAVDDVSFEVERGECLGIIGVNGSGKSTILKMLNGIYMPDKGRIEINGKVGALIELGAGFHPILTGRENIYINGAVLGMSKKEIDAKFQDIVDFADIGDFLDTPVKSYSSGMLVRLGFAVAIHLHPEVFLIDEVLSVGDAGFQQKCIQKINEFKGGGGTAIFVSHNMMSVQGICNRVIWLNKAKVRQVGDPFTIIQAYLDNSYTRQSTGNEIPEQDLGEFQTKIKISKVVCRKNNLEETDTFDYGDDIIIEFQYDCVEDVSDAFFGLALWKNSVEVFRTTMLAKGTCKQVNRGNGFVRCKLEPPMMTPGEYEVGGWIQRVATAELGQKYYHPPQKMGRFSISEQEFIKEENLRLALDLQRYPAHWCRHKWE